MKIGLFGGTFNPIHYGHLRGAEEVREHFALHKVIFIPSGIPPLKILNLKDKYHRLEMTKLAIESNPYFEVSDYEIKLDAPSYTINTVKFFKNLYQGHTLWFIIGVDSFLELPKWYKHGELLKMIDFIVMSRPKNLTENYILESCSLIGEKIEENVFQLKNSDKKLYFINITPFSISSTLLREKIRKNESIKYLVPDKVISYIEANKLYRS